MDDPICGTCGIERSHVSHHDPILYNFHDFTPLAKPDPEPPCTHHPSLTVLDAAGRILCSCGVVVETEYGIEVD